MKQARKQLQIQPVCNYGSMNPGWPPEYPVTQNSCVLARRFWEQILWRHRCHVGYRWLCCYYWYSSCACARWTYPVLKHHLWRSTGTHRTVVTDVTIVLSNQIFCSHEYLLSFQKWHSHWFTLCCRKQRDLGTCINSLYIIYKSYIYITTLTKILVFLSLF